jgi:hypothetical protein
MPLLMIRCPNTGREVSTGLAASAKFAHDYAERQLGIALVWKARRTDIHERRMSVP